MPKGCDMYNADRFMQYCAVKWDFKKGSCILSLSHKSLVALNFIVELFLKLNVFTKEIFFQKCYIDMIFILLTCFV